MIINLTDFFKNPGKSDIFNIAYEADCFETDRKYFIKDKKEINLKVSFVSEREVLLEGFLELDLESVCDRCLEPVIFHLNINIDTRIYSDEEFLEDCYFMEGLNLDSEEFLNSELMMGLPMKVLCKDDCLGLCLKCGGNRNKVKCSCDTFVPDPRMAAIQDIFNAYNKEV